MLSTSGLNIEVVTTVLILAEFKELIVSLITLSSEEPPLKFGNNRE
jgi:hypothetical protein